MEEKGPRVWLGDPGNGAIRRGGPESTGKCWKQQGGHQSGRHPGSRGPLSTDWMSGWGRQPDGWDEGPTLASMRRRGLGSRPALRASDKDMTGTRSAFLNDLLCSHTELMDVTSSLGDPKDKEWVIYVHSAPTYPPRKAM